MSTPHASGWYSATPRTKGEMKAGLDLINDVMSELPGGANYTTLTIASGAVTVTQFFHQMQTEGGASTDDLTTITSTGIPYGRLLLLRIATAGHTVVAKHNAGGSHSLYLANAEDFTMTQIDQWLLLINYGGIFFEITRCYGTDSASHRDYLGLGTAAVLDTGTAVGDVVVMATGPKLPAVDGSALTAIKKRGDYILVVDKQTAGTAGGTFTTGAWRTRPLNTEWIDEAGICTLAANRITLTSAGYYYLHANAPAYYIPFHQARFYEISGTITYGNMVSGVIPGTPEYGLLASFIQNRSTVIGKFYLSAGDIAAGHNVFELQHYGTATKATNGFGFPGSIGDEIYATVELWRTDI